MAAPFVSSVLALMSSRSRPDLDGSALKAALLAGTRSSGVLSGAARRRLARRRRHPARRRRRDRRGPLAARALPAARAGRGAILNWSLDGDTAAVARVRVYLDGKPVAARAAARASTASASSARPGLHRWRVDRLRRGQHAASPRPTASSASAPPTGAAQPARRSPRSRAANPQPTS